MTWSEHLAEGQYKIWEGRVLDGDCLALYEVLLIHARSGVRLPIWAVAELKSALVKRAQAMGKSSGGRRANPIEDARLLWVDGKRFDLVALVRLAQGKPPPSLPKPSLISAKEAFGKLEELAARNARRECSPSAQMLNVGKNMDAAFSLSSELARGTFYRGSPKQFERSYSRIDRVRRGKSHDRNLPYSDEMMHAIFE